MKQSEYLCVSVRGFSQNNFSMSKLFFVVKEIGHLMIS